VAADGEHIQQRLGRVRVTAVAAVDDVDTLTLSTSADRRLAASSKVVRVRVLGSKKRLTMVLPRSSGTFLTARPPTPAKDSA
jgi:hypothetical protein